MRPPDLLQLDWMTRTDRLCLLCLASTDGIGTATIRRLVEGAREREIALCEAMRRSAVQLRREFGVPPAAASVIEGIEAPLSRAEALLDLLARHGVTVVLEDSPDYPAALLRSLGRTAPPVLFLRGNAGVLARRCVAIVGSRRPSRAAAVAAHNLACVLAKQGTTIVSGGASGIDTVSHRAAMTAGATAVVPPVGILRFRWRGMGREAPGEGAWCIVGQFPPQAGWRKSHALLRNRSIVGASDAVVGFEPRDVGGTWHSCVTALRLRKPLFLVCASRGAAQQRGLKRLVRLGARALDWTG